MSASCDFIHLSRLPSSSVTSNEKHAGKMNFEPAQESHPYGEINAGKWFKRVARPLVRYLADVIQLSVFISAGFSGHCSVDVVCVYRRNTFDERWRPEMPSCVPDFGKLRHEHLQVCNTVQCCMSLWPAPHPVCWCRDRFTRTLLGFLPILDKGYTAAEVDTDAFRERSYELVQQALEIVSISAKCN